MSSGTTAGRDRRVYRRRETSLQPRYRATVAQRVSRNGAGISSDSRLSVDDELLLRPLDRPEPITGSRAFSISASCKKQGSNAARSVSRLFLAEIRMGSSVACVVRSVQKCDRFAVENITKR